jgi:hypothetical protein
VLEAFNGLFNAYCFATREKHEWRNYISSETTKGAAEVAAEREIFGTSAAA